MKKCITYEEALQHYTELTQTWLEHKANGLEDKANEVRTKRYFYLDEMNRLNPENEKEKVGGFIL